MRTFLASLLVLAAASLSAQSLTGQSATGPLSDRRKNLQSAFSVCQARIYAAPEKAPAEAHQEMEKFNAELMKFRDEVIAFETPRYRLWNNESFWMYSGSSGKRYSYWTSGPGARLVVDKLGAQLDKAGTMSAQLTGPFTRVHLNQSQQLLDALRTVLSLDSDLETMARNYLKK